MSDGTTSDGAVDGRDALLATARAWRDQDPDDRTRAELDAVITRVESGDDAAAADLADRFAGRLQFGTAGLRGALGAGSNRMNRVLVAQAAAGFAAFLLGREAEPSIVIGYDGRTNSDVFARDTAEIMAAAGVAATILPRALPTPVLAFAVRHLDVSAGVMVTASHNPPQDNGYKVYLGGVDRGSQIVSPVDGEIAAEIERAAAAPVTGIARSDDYREAGDDLVMEYVRRTAAVAGTAATGRQPRVVYTALHGVGWEVARRVFATAGFAEPIPVSEQSAPDAAFPTVAFPNPEEPGAMDLSFATADRVEADLIIANDPDADRLAVAIPVDGGWRRLSGNEVGSLLGWRAAERAREADVDGTLAASIVSSPRCGRSPGSTDSTTSTPSPGSNGCRASAACSTATRRPSATSSTPTSSATRTASRPPSTCWPWRRSCTPRARASPSTSSPSTSGSEPTRRRRSRSASTTSRRSRP
nr:hypothetical protein GCM10025699_46050 [Microbacterium flavescens]